MRHIRARGTLVLAVLVLAPLVAVGAAIATPGSGFTLREVVAR
jgi:hypothetical protein